MILLGPTGVIAPPPYQSTADKRLALAALRTTMIESLWGVGGSVPVAGASATDIAWDDGALGGAGPKSTLTGCARVDRFTHTLSRNGVAYSYLCYPTADAIGRVMVTIAGQCVAAYGWSSAGNTTAWINYWLALGYHVLVVETLCEGSQPNPLLLDKSTSGQWSCERDAGGYHNPAVFKPVELDGLNVNALYVEPAIMGINAANALLSPDHTYISGLSTGAYSATLVAALGVCDLTMAVFGFFPRDYRVLQAYVDSVEWAMSSICQLWRDLDDYDVLALAAFDGRQYINCLGVNDNVGPPKYPRMNEWQARANTRLDGGTLGTHLIHVDTAATQHEFSVAGATNQADTLRASINALHPGG